MDLSGTIDPTYVAAHRLEDASILKAIDSRSTLDYNFRGTPQTVVISRDGFVRQASNGFLNANSLAALERVLSDL